MESNSVKEDKNSSGVTLLSPRSALTGQDWDAYERAEFEPQFLSLASLGEGAFRAAVESSVHWNRMYREATEHWGDKCNLPLEGCSLLAVETGDGWLLEVANAQNVVIALLALLAWPTWWPETVEPRFLRKSGFKIVPA